MKLAEYLADFFSTFQYLMSYLAYIMQHIPHHLKVHSYTFPDTKMLSEYLFQTIYNQITHVHNEILFSYILLGCYCIGGYAYVYISAREKARFQVIAEASVRPEKAVPRRHRIRGRRL